MRKFFGAVIRLRYALMALFLLAAALCAVLKGQVAVNYDINDYLPADSASTAAIDVMGEEFDGAIPNARVMVRDVTQQEASEYKSRIEAVDGVLSVTWLDSLISGVPIEMYPASVAENYWKDGCALFTVTFDESKQLTAVNEVYDIIGEDNAMTGSAVNMVVATQSTVKEVRLITVCSVLFLLLVLILTTDSFVHAPVVLIGLGTAVVLNGGSNLIFGEISFVTNSAGTILQLAVSLDYSVFLIHRFDEFRKALPAKEAMREALTASVSSIFSSGLTTVIGFLALCMMRFQIGPDLGLALAKGVAISLMTVFLFMPGVILCCCGLMDRTRHGRFLPSFERFGGFVRRVTIPLALIFAVSIAPAYIGSTRNTYYYGASHIFGTDTRLGRDTQAIEEMFGQSDTWVLMVPKGETAKETKLLEALEETEGITGVTSLITYMGSMPAEMAPEKIRSQLQSERYDRIVLTAGVPYEGDETVALVQTVRSLAEDAYSGEWQLAGNAVSTADLREVVTADMLKVNLLAIGAVFLVLLLTMRSLLLPVLLVLTIETAIWVNLSVPYLTGETVFYIAYLIISSIQLGATVDYAILFTDRYRENRLAGIGRGECVQRTIADTAVSILTSGTCMTVIGFLMGKVSSHGLLSQLGMLLGKGTLCSTFAVLFVLPGLLRLTDRFIVKKK